MGKGMAKRTLSTWCGETVGEGSKLVQQDQTNSSSQTNRKSPRSSQSATGWYKIWLGGCSQLDCWGAVDRGILRLIHKIRPTPVSRASKPSPRVKHSEQVDGRRCGWLEWDGESSDQSTPHRAKQKSVRENCFFFSVLCVYYTVVCTLIYTYTSQYTFLLHNKWVGHKPLAICAATSSGQMGQPLELEATSHPRFVFYYHLLGNFPHLLPSRGASSMDTLPIAAIDTL